MCRKCIDLIGKKFCKLTVLKIHHKEQNYYKSIKNGFKVYFLCRCDCGNEKVILKSSLLNGRSKSCGCLQKEIVSEISKKQSIHNLCNTRIYKIWGDMKI